MGDNVLSAEKAVIMSGRKKIPDIDKVVVMDNNIDDFAIYLGGLTRLKDITKEFVYDSEMINGYLMESITLGEIREQAESIGYKDKLITVISNAPLEGAIYQLNNYLNGKWYKIGDTIGYA